MDARVTVLLIEDDTLDVKTIRRAFKENCMENPLVVVPHGEEALAFLRKQGVYEGAPTPGLILLDLQMPVMNGIEFLQAYRNDIAINTPPVVVLTTSKAERDTVAAYQLGVGGYMEKPIDFLRFVKLVKTLDTYWSLCELPSTPRAPRRARKPSSIAPGSCRRADARTDPWPVHAI